MTRTENQDSTLALAVIGFAAGVIGVWALDRADWLMWNRSSAEDRALTTAIRPNGEPPAETLVSKLSYASDTPLDAETHRTASLVTHYAIGVMPTMLYAIFRNKLPVKGLTRGLLYGGTMFAAQDEGLNTLAGLGADPRSYPVSAHARGLVAHLIYGIVAEVAIDGLTAGKQRFVRA